MDEIHDTGQQPIAQYQAVTPLGAQYPVEFALPRVKAEGQLTCIVRELWNQPAWWALQDLTGTQNIIDIYNFMANTPTPITCTTLISMPSSGYPKGGSANNKSTAGGTLRIGGTGGLNVRGWTYQNVNVIAIPDSEDVAIGTLTVQKTITMVYSNKVLINAKGLTNAAKVFDANANSEVVAAVNP